jgi:hypothetical protein
MTSSGDTFRARSSRASSVAGRKQTSSLLLIRCCRVQAPATAVDERQKLGLRLNTSQRVSHSTGPTAK